MKPELSLEQQFELKKCSDATHQMTKEQVIDLLIKAQRLLMVKTNVVRHLGGHKCK